MENQLLRLGYRGRYPVNTRGFCITGPMLSDSRPLSDTPQIVTAWLTGAQRYLLSPSEQDLDVILESSFSIEQLIAFFSTAGAIDARKSWLAGAVWRVLEAIIEDDFDFREPRPDPQTILKLSKFVSRHLREFNSLGYGQDADCAVLRYIRDLH